MLEYKAGVRFVHLLDVPNRPRGCLFQAFFPPCLLRCGCVSKLGLLRWVWRMRSPLSKVVLETLEPQTIRKSNSQLEAQATNATMAKLVLQRRMLKTHTPPWTDWGCRPSHGVGVQLGTYTMHSMQDVCMHIEIIMRDPLLGGIERKRKGLLLAYNPISTRA